MKTRRTYTPSFSWQPIYQFTEEASKGVFAWANPLLPSIFVERTFQAFKDGKSASEVASEVVKKRENEKGVSPGSIFGISKASDKACEEFKRRSMAKRNARVAA